MTVVLIRGTGGSGKTFIAERVIDALGGLDASQRVALGPRGKTGGYIWFDKNVMVLGRYESQCGGCDTLQWKGAPDDIETVIQGQIQHGRHVLLEGIAISSYGQQRLLRMGPALTVIQLDTTLADCLAAIAARRALKGNTKPVDTYHTERKHKALFTTSRSNAAAGIKVETHSRATALPRVKELLGL
jgi:hypothetical protein